MSFKWRSISNIVLVVYFLTLPILINGALILGGNLGGYPENRALYIYWLFIAFGYSPQISLMLWGIIGVAILLWALGKFGLVSQHVIGGKSIAFLVPTAVLVTACSLPTLPANNVHLESIVTCSGTYQLSEFQFLPWANGQDGYYTLWQCDALGLTCKGRNFVLKHFGYERNSDTLVKFVANADGCPKISVDSHILTISCP